MTDEKIHFAFSFTVFSMRMKLYRQGLDPSRLLKLMSRESKKHRYDNVVEKRTAFSKIVAGSMFIREQRIFMMPPTHPVMIPKYTIVRCEHMGIYESLPASDVSFLTKWIESRNYQDGSRLSRCKYCFTEFRIDFKELGRRGNALYVTKWQDLGQGVSPLDPKWQSHILERQPYKRVKWKLGSIFSAFEGKEHVEFEFDSL
jgi:hypothetical protein